MRKPGEETHQKEGVTKISPPGENKKDPPGFPFGFLLVYNTKNGFRRRVKRGNKEK